MRGEDLRERVLNRSMEDRYGGGAPNRERAIKSTNPKKLRSRFEHLDEFFDDFKPSIYYDISVKFRIERKKFFGSAFEPFNEETQRQITPGTYC